MIRKILPPTDLSELSRVGVRYALKEARDNGAEVTIYHVATGDEMLKLGDRLKEHGSLVSGSFDILKNYLHTYEVSLAQFVGQNFADLLPFVRVNEKVELGSPEKSIVERAKAEGVDLIIMATHGRSGSVKNVFGERDESSDSKRSGPVLAIPPYSAEVRKDLYVPAQ
jgi:nucleotide-binding universal stress UspA family protein